jgi:hypothetical protein
MRKAIASMGVGSHERLLRVARPTFQAYADRHGYDLHLHTELVDRSRPVAWSRIPILQSLVGRYDAVVWLDCDLVIVDGRRDLADELRPDRFLYLVEHRYGGHRVLNTGVMMLRGGAEAADFLQRVWEQEQFVDHGWWEQAAVMHLLGYRLDGSGPRDRSPYRERTELLSPVWNWAWFARVPRARIRHFPMLSPLRRIPLMLAARAEALVRAGLSR